MIKTIKKPWWDVQYSGWHENWPGVIFRTQDLKLAKQIAKPHGHVIILMAGQVAT